MNALLPIIHSIIQSVQPKRIVHCGIRNESVHRSLLQYCSQHNIHVHSADNNPECDTQKIQRDFPSWTVSKDFGINVIPRIKECDMIILDEDANWFTTYQTILGIYHHICAQDLHKFPVVLLHNTGNPYGYRDHYRHIDSIPLAYRQASHEVIHKGHEALYERNPQNGVRKALEDFIHDYSAQGILQYAFLEGDGGLCILAPVNTTTAIHDLIQNLTTDGSLKQCIESLISSSLNAIKEKPKIPNIVSPQEEGHSTRYALNIQQLKNIQALQEVKMKKERDSFERTIDTMQKQQDDAINSMMKTYERTLKEKEQEIAAASTHEKNLLKMQYQLAHIYKTKSWRWTAFLRLSSPKNLEKRITYAIFSAAKDIWVDFDKPFPRLVNFVRYTVFQKYPPRTQEIVSTSNTSMTQFTEKEPPRKLSLAKALPLNTIALLYGRSNQHLSETLHSAVTQSVPFLKIIVLYTSKDEYIVSCMSNFPHVIFQKEKPHYLLSKIIKTAIKTYKAEYISTVPIGCILPSNSHQFAHIPFLKRPHTTTIQMSSSQSASAQKTSHLLPILCRSAYFGYNNVPNTPIANILVFVITNSHTYIDQCINSVLLQTLCPHTIIVLSEDEYLVPAMQYKSAVNIEAHLATKESLGGQIHWHISSLQPEFVSILHEDDFLHHSFFQKSISALEDNASTPGTLGNKQIFGSARPSSSTQTPDLYRTVLRTQFLPDLRSATEWEPSLHVPDFQYDALHHIDVSNYHRHVSHS